MAIWDEISQDPLKMMILMQGMQELPRSLSRQYLPPSNMPGYAQGGGYGGGGGGSDGGLDMGSILRMQQLQAAQANQQADNELQRQAFSLKQREFDAGQQAAQKQAEMDAEAAAQLGVHPSVLALAREKFGENFAERFGMTTLSPGEVATSNGQEIARNAPLLQATDSGVFNPDPRSGGAFQTNQDMLRNALARAAAGATRVTNTTDNRNMNNGFDAMLGQSMEDRKAMAGKTEKLNALAAATSEMADIAVANPKVFDPTADVEALMTQGEGILKKWVAKEPLTPEQTQFLSAYNRAKQLNVTEGFGLVADLKPVSEAEVKLGLQTALGPGKPIPQVLVRSVQAQLAARRQADLQNEFDRSQALMLQAARRGEFVYSPAAHRMHMMEWEKNNPVSADAFQDVLATLSKKFPYGGGGAEPPPSGDKTVEVPQPKPSGTADVPAHLQKYFK